MFFPFRLVPGFVIYCLRQLQYRAYNYILPYIEWTGVGWIHQGLLCRVLTDVWVLGTVCAFHALLMQFYLTRCYYVCMLYICEMSPYRGCMILVYHTDLLLHTDILLKPNCHKSHKIQCNPYIHTQYPARTRDAR